MSTAVLLNLPEHGHMNATFPLVAELVKRGERVIYCATEPYRRQIESAGCEFVAYGAPGDLTPPAHEGGLYSVMAYLMDRAEVLVPRLLGTVSEARPDYLLIDSMCVWGNLLQQILGLPAVTLGSVFVPNDRLVTTEELVRMAYQQAPPKVILAGIDALNTYLQVSKRLDKRYGTRSPDIVGFFSNRQQLNVMFTSAYFHPLGDQYDGTYKFVGPSLAPREENHGFPLEELDGRPLVYISLGTIFNDRPEFYHTCLEALGDSAYQVVMAVGTRVDRTQLPALRGGAIVCEFAPQLAVLERTSLFITHGGMNSTSEALWFGVPLLVFPQHGDQHLVAQRVAELGAGVALRPSDLAADRLRGLAEDVLNGPDYLAQAQTISASFRAAGGCVAAAGEIIAAMGSDSH